MAYHFDKNAEKWLEDKGFTSDEKQELLGLLNRYEGKMKDGTKNIILPKSTSGKVAAFFDLLFLIKNADGKPMCFEKTSIQIPNEAQDRYSEGMELHELETVVGKLKTAKFARGRMDPRRRSSKYG